MLRVSWPLAILLAALVAIVARRPRLLLPVLIAAAIWALWQVSAGRGARRR